MPKLPVENDSLLPDHFIRTQHELYGERGAAWLANLPALIAECEQRWSIRVGAPFDELSYNFVAPAVRAGGNAVVLKMAVPNPEFGNEIAALRLYAGQGACRLLEAEPDEGAMLLEHLQPGTMLAELADDEAATAIAADVMRQLWRPVAADHAFPTTATWAKGLERLRAQFDGGVGPFPKALVERAEALFAELLANAAEPMLLHGDLHHFNILRAERAPWLAIDPKGIVGDPAFEIGALLGNPTAKPKAVQARRVDQLSEALDLDRTRVLGWSVAQAVLSAWWSYEDHGRVGDSALARAAMLAELMDR